jgi:hypothetical protein
MDAALVSTVALLAHVPPSMSTVDTILITGHTFAAIIVGTVEATTKVGIATTPIHMSAVFPVTLFTSIKAFVISGGICLADTERAGGTAIDELGGSCPISAQVRRYWKRPPFCLVVEVAGFAASFLTR